MTSQIKKKKLLKKQLLPQKLSKNLSKIAFLAKQKLLFNRRKKKRFLSRTFSYPSSLQQKKRVLFFKNFMWYFTHKKLRFWGKKKHDVSFSTQYLQSLQRNSEDFKNGVSKKSLFLRYLKKYLKEYVKLFRPDNWKKMEIRILKKRHKGKLSNFFFQPWKKMLIPPTKKQRWLKTAYNQQQKIRFKDRIDFFRTYMGQMIGSVYWRKTGKSFYTNPPVPVTQMYFNYYFCHKVSWWYENLIQKKKTPRSVKRFTLDRPKTAFQVHWTQQKLEPWKDSLLFKRALYGGFGEDYRKENKFQPLKIKNYLRSKNPRQEKRNRLYTRVNFLLNNFRQRSRIRADKYARIKQVTSKMLRPFYGHLRPHQIKYIVKKSKKTTSKILGNNEIILKNFENRLDVVVYRMNLAPSILWARRLVKTGFVFVTPQENHFLWESMYGGLKKLAFPLQLRDPKNLYTKTYWTYTQENWVEFKFLGEPKKKISYLLQPGDLIQCAAGAYLNHFKTRSWLCRKPIAKHLMVPQKKTYVWHWPAQKLKQQTFKTWEQNSVSVYSGIFLNSPQYRDLDSKDRVKESFLRWAIY
jgi:hypothetical protein